MGPIFPGLVSELFHISFPCFQPYRSSEVGSRFAPWQSGFFRELIALFSHINSIFCAFHHPIYKAGMKSELRDWTILDKKSSSYWQFTVLTLSMCLPRVVYMSPRQQIPERETCDRRFLTCEVGIECKSTDHGKIPSRKSKTVNSKLYCSSHSKYYH